MTAAPSAASTGFSAGGAAVALLLLPLLPPPPLADEGPENAAARMDDSRVAGGGGGAAGFAEDDGGADDAADAGVGAAKAFSRTAAMAGLMPLSFVEAVTEEMRSGSRLAAARAVALAAALPGGAMVRQAEATAAPLRSRPVSASGLTFPAAAAPYRHGWAGMLNTIIGYMRCDHRG